MSIVADINFNIVKAPCFNTLLWTVNVQIIHKISIKDNAFRHETWVQSNSVTKCISAVIGSIVSNFKFSQEGKDTFISLHCDRETKAVREKDIMDAFSESAFYDAYLLTEEVINFTELANEKIENIEKGEYETADIGHQIAEIRDAELLVTISPDKMTAKLKIVSAYGGEMPSLDDVKETCKAQGLRFGLKRSKIEKLLEKGFDAAPGEIFEGDIAFGLDPKHGKNARFKPLIELFSDKLRKPAEKEGGKVDLRDLGDIETVKPGQKIYQKIPPTDGKPGRNVLGDDLPPTPGKDADLELSQGTIIDERDPNILVASREGLARVIDERMEVDNVYTISELTPKQGHIKFNGTVIISGDVSPDMRVVATGDVVVGGFVESASIRCQGEITVIAGASGKLLEPEVEGRQYNCLLEAGNRINIAFANQIDIRSKRDVFVHKQLSHCNLIAASLRVGQGIKANGKLIGGNIEVSKGIEVGHMGAPAGADTKISMNRTFKIFKQKENQIWEKLQPMMEEQETLKDKLKMLMSEEQKHDLKRKIAKTSKLADKLSYQRKRIIQRRRDYMDVIEIHVNHTLYAGTVVEFGGKNKVNDRQRGPSIIRLNEQQIEIEPK